MKKTSSKIYLVATLLVLVGAGIKLVNVAVGYGDWIVICGMALGLIGVNTYINEVKKEQ